MGCSPIKAVRELGLERRETVWSLSAVSVENCKARIRVREDRIKSASGVPVVYFKALPGS